jgi:hypothetical protein
MFFQDHIKKALPGYPGRAFIYKCKSVNYEYAQEYESAQLLHCQQSQKRL